MMNIRVRHLRPRFVRRLAIVLATPILFALNSLWLLAILLRRAVAMSIHLAIELVAVALFAIPVVSWLANRDLLRAAKWYWSNTSPLPPAGESGTQGNEVAP